MESDEDILNMVRMAIDAGASGVAIGRNIFQAENPTKMTRAIAMIVHDNAEVKESLEYLRS